MDIIPNFVVLEGGDGSGTTTQLKLLTRRAKAEGKSVYPTCEPTDGEIGRLIRLALKGDFSCKPKTLAMLFAADRNEHINGPGGILSRSNDPQKLVVSDRFTLSSFVYQGIECGEELPFSLNKDFPLPEITIFLDLDPKIAMERMKGRDTFEIYEYLGFQEKVRDRYKKAIKSYCGLGAKVETIDASKNAQEVSDQVWSIVSQMPIFKTR